MFRVVRPTQSTESVNTDKRHGNSRRTKTVFPNSVSETSAFFRQNTGQLCHLIICSSRVEKCLKYSHPSVANQLRILSDADSSSSSTSAKGLSVILSLRVICLIPSDAKKKINILVISCDLFALRTQLIIVGELH